MTVSCRQCGDDFEDWGGLATHIMAAKKTHKKKSDRIWAAKYIAGNTLRHQQVLSKSGEDPDKVRTEFGDDNRENSKRRLSGTQNYVNAVCPKCKKPHRPLIETDYVEDAEVWRIDDKLVKLCVACER